jgi:hypothetical protein
LEISWRRTAGLNEKDGTEDNAGLQREVIETAASNCFDGLSTFD